MTEIVKTEKASVYEVGYHIVPAVSPENLTHEVDVIKGILEKVGGKIISEEFPKMKNLSYQMLKVVGPVRSKYDTAYFGWVKYEGSPESQADIKKALDADEKILRYLLIKTVAENTLYSSKVLTEDKKEGEKVEELKTSEVPVSEDLDKSIDKLVA